MKHVKPDIIIFLLPLWIALVACDDSERPGLNGTADGTSDSDSDAVSDTGSDAQSDLQGFFPATVDTSYARKVYDAWNKKWVKSCGNGELRVEWDTADKTVSEGIGYGMLLAASWADQETFDGLWAYYQSHTNNNGLMGWIGGCGYNDDDGAATDADLDTAMALIIADCAWPDSGYGNDATDLIGNLKAFLFKTDGAHIFQCAGDGWGDDCCGDASYQAPAYYRVFGKHTDDAAYWEQAADDTYYYLNANNNATTGLVSDWMDPEMLKCDAKGWGDWHGWDASRVPWRVTTDYLWWNSKAGKEYAEKIAAFVESKGGVAQTCAGYDLAGNTCGGDPVTTFAGAFATSGMAVDQATADSFFANLKTVPNSGYFNETLNALYFTNAAGQFRPGCY